MSNIVSLTDRKPVRTAGGNHTGRRRQFGHVRRLPSKKWQASYTGPDDHRHNAPTTFQTKGDALAWLAMQQTKIIEHRWRPAPPPSSVKTLRIYSDAWLAARDLKPRTRSEYRRILDQRILPTLGDSSLSAITAADVRAWYAALDSKLKTARAHAYGLLRTILTTAVNEELVEVNPCRIAGANSTKRAKSIRPASLPELATIVETMPPRYRIMVLLASWCALRYGELAELRRADLDLGVGIIRVQRAVTWPDGKAVIGTPKSDAGARDVHIPPHLLEPIRDHIGQYAAAGRNGLLFPNANGDHLHHGSLYKVYKPARLAAGRPDLRFHDLRHTGAVLAAQTGATLAELMNRLGHSTVGAAMRYQHASQDRDAEIARRLSAIADGVS